MLALLFGIKCKKKMLAKPNNAKKVLALSVRAYRLVITCLSIFFIRKSDSNDQLKYLQLKGIAGKGCEPR